jgi:hypothetical protein
LAATFGQRASAKAHACSNQVTDDASQAIKAAPHAAPLARPPPGSALGRPPGAGAPSHRSTPQIRLAIQHAGAAAQAAIFLGFDCPARAHRA